MRKHIIILVALLAVLPACGGKRSTGSAEVPTIKGVVREDNTTLLLEADRAGGLYIIQGGGLAFELRNLVGMRVAVSGPIITELEGVPVMQVSWYDLLPFASGERPIVGWISPGGYIRTQEDITWVLEGDFKDLLATFAGAKVWVIGVVRERINTSQGALRVIDVTDYGIILQ